MQSKIGVHVTSGSRLGYGEVAPHIRGSVSFFADSFGEMDASGFTVWRPNENTNVYRWETHYDPDIMPGWNDLTLADMVPQANYWWPIIKATVEAEEARLNIRIDALKLTNEVPGGDDRTGLEKLAAYETELCRLAHADGRVLVIGNFATDSPRVDTGLWEEIAAPYIIRCCRDYDAIYSRHVYSDIVDGQHRLTVIGSDANKTLMPAGNSTRRLFDELDHFREMGYRIPTIVGELGFVEFPGVDILVQEVGNYDILLNEYPEIGFASIFTYGEWKSPGKGNNIQAASSALAAYLRPRPFSLWVPTFQDTSQPPPPEPGRHKAIVVKAPQEVTDGEWLQIAAYAKRYLHTMTASHDDTLTVLAGGNAESYAKIFQPDRPSQLQTITALEQAGFKWEPLYLDSTPPEPPPTQPVADVFTAPVGTAAQREAGELWN